MRDLTSEAALTAALSAYGLPGDQVAVYHTLPSTNTALREQALCGAPHGTIIWAHTQSAGRGSRSRSFYAPPGGLYFSVLLRNYTDPTQITCAAAVAVREAILQVLGIETDIKWVNDLYLSGRKVCGILCEGISVGNSLTAAVLGIGINLVAPPNGFPTEIAQIAGALCNAAPPKQTLPLLICEILAHLQNYLQDPGRAYMVLYRKHNLVIGRQVQYRLHSRVSLAQVVDITPTGSLLLRHESGQLQDASFGEITLI